jgi:hypothetical protein
VHGSEAHSFRAQVRLSKPKCKVSKVEFMNPAAALLLYVCHVMHVSPTDATSIAGGLVW